ncbi:MAG: aminoacyl-histidine dipeptidase [candidate division KSB1 bacterium]|nr:aminoacyl-histidine dipeptidase [candidate division KSB1 bacterium]
MSPFEGLKPALLWKHFDRLRQIPRPSGQEKAAADYVLSVAKSLGLEAEQDAVGNVVVRKKASPGHENAPTVVLQSHLDMVCEKNADKVFDFNRDPIQVKIKDGWLTADGTTLGADNGIGVAAMLAIFEDNTLIHGPLEGLFTVDEERGLVGARGIPKDALKGRILINLDSEDLGVFSIGCAGGRDSNLTLPIRRRKPSGEIGLDLQLSGLKGGHSGVDIHLGRGNAIKILNRLLYQANQKRPFELVSLEGGDKHNAIPREAFARIVIRKNDLDELKTWFAQAIDEIRREFYPAEDQIVFNLKTTDEKGEVLIPEDQKRLTALLFALPHGVLAMSRVIEKLVETSNNVAAVHTKADRIEILCSSRSSNMNALQATVDKIKAIAELAGAAVEQPPGYPGWQPNLDSPILKLAMSTFKQVTGKEARYEAIHAGLECGIIGERFPGMDMISIGPTIKYPHSPDEKVEIASVELFYQHVIKMLEALA